MIWNSLTRAINIRSFSFFTLQILRGVSSTQQYNDQGTQTQHEYSVCCYLETFTFWHIWYWGKVFNIVINNVEDGEIWWCASKTDEPKGHFILLYSWIPWTYFSMLNSRLYALQQTFKVNNFPWITARCVTYIHNEINKKSKNGFSII